MLKNCAVFEVFFTNWRSPTSINYITKEAVYSILFFGYSSCNDWECRTVLTMLNTLHGHPIEEMK